MEKIAKLRAQRGTLIDELNDLAEHGTKAQYDAKKAEIAEVEAKIARMEESRTLQSSLARPSDGSPILDDGADDFGFGRGNVPMQMLQISEQLRDLNPRLARFGDGAAPDFDAYMRRSRAKLRMSTIDPAKQFRSFGEQLQAIFNFYQSRGTNVDSRLVRAPTGAGEVDPTGGGFLVQTDFQTAIWMLAHDMGELLSRVNKVPISANANGLKIPGVDETSRATGSRWGGVQSYWAAEGTTATATKPKFRMIEFDLKKLLSFMYATDELIQDSTALMTIAGTAFSEEVMFMTEDAIFEGTGAGQPFGVMNSPALVTVAKDSGQPALSISKANIDNMWSRMWSRSRKNGIWFMNQDIEPQLAALNGPVGTGGELVYMPPGGLAGAPNATLKGRPLIATEYNNSLGAAGDLTLLDLSQYTIVDKGGVQAATSMHIAFLTDETVFRLTYRVDGRPMWHVPLTPFKGSNTKSPFIALASR